MEGKPRGKSGDLRASNHHEAVGMRGDYFLLRKSVFKKFLTSCEHALD
jgi:hypothetical protein